MNTRDLEYFTKLCELKNFSVVADFFGVSQPTISFALKRLETTYGVELIHRNQSHNTLTVTEAGTLLNEHAQTILRELQHAASELTALQQETVTLGLPPIIGNYYFPSVVTKLMKSGLMQHIHTIEAGSSALLTRLRTGELDMALLGSVGPLNEPDLAVTELATTPFTLIASKYTPIGTNGKVAFADLANEPFITLTEGFVHTQVFDHLTQESGIQPQIVFRTGDVGLIKKMVAQGVGVALLVGIAVSDDDNLQTLTLTDTDQPRFSIAVVHRKGQVLPPLLRKIQGILSGD